MQGYAVGTIVGSDGVDPVFRAGIECMPIDEGRPPVQQQQRWLARHAKQLPQKLLKCQPALDSITQIMVREGVGVQLVASLVFLKISMRKFHKTMRHQIDSKGQSNSINSFLSKYRPGLVNRLGTTSVLTL